MQDGLTEQFVLIESHQAETAWRDYVYSLFKNENNLTGKRRRNVALALSETTPIPPRDFHLLSPEIAAMYAKKTGKTVARDIKELLETKLIARKGNGYVADRSALNAFKPLTRPRTT